MVAIVLHTAPKLDRYFTLAFIDIATHEVVIVSKATPLRGEVDKLIGKFPENVREMISWLCEFPPEYLR
jgi:hypothetical protein